MLGSKEQLEKAVVGATWSGKFGRLTVNTDRSVDFELRDCPYYEGDPALLKPATCELRKGHGRAEFGDYSIRIDLPPDDPNGETMIPLAAFVRKGTLYAGAGTVARLSAPHEGRFEFLHGQVLHIHANNGCELEIASKGKPAATKCSFEPHDGYELLQFEAGDKNGHPIERMFGYLPGSRLLVSIQLLAMRFTRT